MSASESFGAVVNPFMEAVCVARGELSGNDRIGITDPGLTHRWYRWASVLLLLVLAALSAYSLVSSLAVARLGRQATSSHQLSDDYDRAASALALEESLERKYRLEPSSAVLASHTAASVAMIAALTRAGTDGVAADRALVDGAIRDHARYLQATHRMFRAVDGHQPAKVLEIDNQVVDPAFTSIEKDVAVVAANHHAAALRELSAMEARISLLGKMTPIVFAIGLLLIAFSALILRNYRRGLLAAHGQSMHDSLHDAMTGLPNRALLEDRLTQALKIAHRDGTLVGVLLIDLNHFKEVNDAFGHPFGDLLLNQVGPRLRSVLRDVDTIARFGGDEFAAVLPEINRAEAVREVAEVLNEAIQQPFRVEGVDLVVEASIGASISGVHGDDPETLLQRADAAMFVAKNRNIGVFAYDSEVNECGPGRLTLLGEVRRALDEHELVLHYQPKVSLTTGEVCGAEALVRWQHPERGLLSPDEFLPALEQTGLVNDLTRYVIDAALAQARRWADDGRPLTVSVNLSARNLLEERLLVDVAKALHQHGVPPHLLELELTESAIMTEPARAVRLLFRLRELGVGLSLDDFGAGSTSLAHLMNLPVDELKIDRSFVIPMADDQRAARIVASLIDLGHNLGLLTVAEGVENAAVLDTLGTLGCDVVQGFFLARPMRAEDFDAWYAAHKSLPTTGPHDRDRTPFVSPPPMLVPGAAWR